MKKDRIILLKTWTTNIGNAFIDNGAKYLISNAFPEHEIIEVSGYSNYVADEKAIRGDLIYALEKCFNINLRKKEKIRLNMINISEFIDAKYAFLPGCVLYEHALRKYYKTIEILIKKGIKIVLIGVGGGDYNKSTINYTRNILKKIEPEAIFTRDEKAYESYRDYSKISFNGIDCAFFINDYYQPPKSDTEFVVATFEKMDEPELKNKLQIIRPNHNPFDYPFVGYFRKYYFGKQKKVNFKKRNLFISDDFKDYLFLYSNGIETHSDRVHACVASLVYGNKAKLYFKTCRAALFERVLDEDITSNLVSLDQEKLKKEKAKMLEKLKELDI